MAPPSRKQAEEWLDEARQACLDNGGTDGWAPHSKYVAEITRAIAAACGMDAEIAYMAGLLHDIGRYDPETSGYKGGGPHGLSGYRLLEEKGYPELARYCLTHTFREDEEISEFGYSDLPPEDRKFIADFIKNAHYTDYDLLVQLADNMALKEGFVTLEQRTIDLMFRYGYGTDSHGLWLDNFRYLHRLKRYFDGKCGRPVYDLIPEFMEQAAAFKYDYLEEEK
jgi:putative nucleotidyltransferase with HDIG domain